MNELLLLIEDMFHVKDRGYVATGEISSGPICVGDRVWVSTADSYYRFVIIGIESISGRVDQAEQGKSIGVLLDGEGGEYLQRGHVLCRDNYPDVTIDATPRNRDDGRR